MKYEQTILSQIVLENKQTTCQEEHITDKICIRENGHLFHIRVSIFPSKYKHNPTKTNASDKKPLEINNQDRPNMVFSLCYNNIIRSKTTYGYLRVLDETIYNTNSTK